MTEIVRQAMERIDREAFGIGPPSEEPARSLSMEALLDIHFTTRAEDGSLWISYPMRNQVYRIAPLCDQCHLCHDNECPPPC